MRIFCKKDLAVILLVVLAAAVSGLAVSYCQKSEGEYSLAQNQTVTMEEVLGYNRLVIENGSAYMAEADCADRYCMAYKPISKSGETIICLPHRLVVEVAGDRESQLPDVIVP